MEIDSVAPQLLDKQDEDEQYPARQKQNAQAQHEAPQLIVTIPFRLRHVLQAIVRDLVTDDLKRHLSYKAVDGCAKLPLEAVRVRIAVLHALRLDGAGR